MPTLARITPCLWFDDQAEAAAHFYTSIFPNSRVGPISRYGAAGFEFHRKPPGTAMTVTFELDGVPFTALNGGPVFRFTEAISLQVYCDTQAEIDHFWSRLGDGGDPAAQQCGWPKDCFGLSWQIVPSQLPRWMTSGAQASERVMTSLLSMQKLDLQALQRAFEHVAA